MKLISIDAETFALRDKAFAISVVTHTTDGSQILFEKRIAEEPTHWPDQWVKENVWPQCQVIVETVEDTTELYQSFSDWWLDMQVGTVDEQLVVIAHCPNPVETGLFNTIASEGYFAQSLKNRGMLEGYNIWDASSPNPSPMCIHDVGTLLLLKGENPHSVDSFLKKEGVIPPNGSPHNPRYDAIAALKAWVKITSRYGIPE
jgi:hypothetical protein